MSLIRTRGIIECISRREIETTWGKTVPELQGCEIVSFVTRALPVHGYHGTSVDVVNKIIDDGFLPSGHDYEWLGVGVYFFQDAPERAYRWAVGRHKASQPAVICSELELDGCLDMLDAV